MAAYVIVHVEIHDPVTYQEYVKMVTPTIAAYGGRFLVRGGRAELLEGDRLPNRVVVLEFETVKRAKEWWSSREYAAPKKLRQSASVAQMIVVEGV